MAQLPETSEWPQGIYQLEVDDPVQGGSDGVSNTQARQLANRTQYLKDQADGHATRIETVEASATENAARIADHATRLSAAEGAGPDLALHYFWRD